MAADDHRGAGNRLLRALSGDDLELLKPHLRQHSLERGTTLIRPDEAIGEAWFLSSGLTSIIAMSGENMGIEVGLTGREGIIGLPLLLDSDRTPHRVFMQVAGAGHQIAAADLQRVLDESAT